MPLGIGDATSCGNFLTVDLQRGVKRSGGTRYARGYKDAQYMACSNFSSSEPVIFWCFVWRWILDRPSHHPAKDCASCKNSWVIDFGNLDVSWAGYFLSMAGYSDEMDVLMMLLPMERRVGV